MFVYLIYICIIDFSIIISKKITGKKITRGTTCNTNGITGNNGQKVQVTIGSGKASAQYLFY